MEEYCIQTIMPNYMYADGPYIQLGLLCAGIGIASTVVYVQRTDGGGIRNAELFENKDMMLLIQQQQTLVEAISIHVDLLYRPQHFDILYQAVVADSELSSPCSSLLRFGKFSVTRFQLFISIYLPVTC